MIMNMAKVSKPTHGQPFIDPDDLIRLLTRCKKMYEAKTLIQRLLKMIVERDRMVEEVSSLQMDQGTQQVREVDTSANKIASEGGTS